MEANCEREFTVPLGDYWGMEIFSLRSRSPARSATRAATVFALVVVVCLLPSGDAQAVVRVADSVEWMTVDSELVVIGRVTGVSEAPLRQLTVNVDVSEVIKGPEVETLTLCWYYDSVVEPNSVNAWQQRGADVLFFLVPAGTEPSERPLPPRDWDRLSRNFDTWAIELSDHGLPALYGMDMTRIGTASELLERVRETVSTGADSAIGSHCGWVPSSAAIHDELYAGSAVGIVAPLTARLERLGRDWLERSDAEWRLSGIDVLAHFPTQANRLLLEPLRGDAVLGESVDQVLGAWGDGRCSVPICQGGVGASHDDAESVEP